MNIFRGPGSPSRNQDNEQPSLRNQPLAQQMPSADDFMARGLSSQSPQSHPNPPGSFPKTQQAVSSNYQTSTTSGQAFGSNSTSTTPVSSSGASGNLPDSRQNVLMSLLGSVPASTSTNPNPHVLRPSTPPLAAPKASSPPGPENAGKMLLEQLMSGSGQKQSNSQPIPNFSPPYNPPAQVPPQSPPSPPRKPSMFDFVSPFDALSSTSTTVTGVAAAGKRKPVPPPGQSSGEESSLSNLQPHAGLEGLRADNKRMSVENLMDTLTRGPTNTQNMAPASDTQTSRPPGMPRTASEVNKPQASAPSKNQTSPTSSFAPAQANRNFQQRGESPTPTTTPAALLQTQGKVEGLDVWRSSDPKPRPLGDRLGAFQSQNIIFDVSQAQENIQAPPDSSLSTPIALVKVEPTFLPGSTIGATSWIAYAMTRGRVRVISRASGDRTLLQLPPAFPSTTSIVDMGVFGNRLAGVTSDGGFVIWELPQVITDDVPGKLLLCVVPPPEPEALKSVRWHPKKPDTVAVASETRIYLISINEASRRFGNDPVAQSDLTQLGQVIVLTSPLVAFAFDVPHFAIATISEDSTLELWRISNQLPFWTAKISGEATPSSIDFLEGGIVIGRKNGTIFQLLPVMSDIVLSTIKFIDTQNREDRDMFGHVAYDSRIQTLWVANSRRESLIALKVAFQPSLDGEEQSRVGQFEQISEFVGPKPSIHFVILTADSDPRGDEAHAACTASKIPPGPLAMVAFSVHSSGVDQIIIRKEWFDAALLQAPSKLPSSSSVPRSGPVNFGNAPPLSGNHQAAVIPSTPPPEDPELEAGKEESVPQGARSRGSKNKVANTKDRDENGREVKEKSKTGESSNPLDSGATPWTKDLRKLEDSLHTRLGRTIGKELDKQQQRLEEARAADQTAEVARQEKIIKLISTELTKNTTRVVEAAVKNEVLSSVLPVLENVVRNEVKAAVNNQIAKGLGDSMKQTLPNEIERLLLRPDVSNHVARTFSQAVTPIIERHVKEAITKTLIPAYIQESASMHQELSRELHAEILSVKKEVITWQSDALRGQEALIRDLEQSVRSLQEQIKYLSVAPTNIPTQVPQPHHHQHRSSPITTQSHGTLSSHIRPGNIQPSSYASPPTSYAQPTNVSGGWYGNSMGSGHAPLMQPAPQVPPAALGPSSVGSGATSETQDWDESYLAVLATEDPRQLRELLARSNPEVVMPLNGNGPLSQAVVLTLIHRLSAAVGETPPVEDAFKASLWWLQRAANTLNPNDPLISPYIQRVLSNVQTMLNTTKQRLSLLPGGPPLIEASRIIGEVQETVMRKAS